MVYTLLHEAPCAAHAFVCVSGNSSFLAYMLPVGRYVVPLQVSVGVAAFGVLCALFFGLWAKCTIVRHKTALSPRGEPPVLIESGAFRNSRNPMYASYILVALCVALGTQSPWVCAPPLLYGMYLCGV